MAEAAEPASLIKEFLSRQPNGLPKELCVRSRWGTQALELFEEEETSLIADVTEMPLGSPTLRGIKVTGVPMVIVLPNSDWTTGRFFLTMLEDRRGSKEAVRYPNLSALPLNYRITSGPDEPTIKLNTEQLEQLHGLLRTLWDNQPFKAKALLLSTFPVRLIHPAWEVASRYIGILFKDPTIDSGAVGSRRTTPEEMPQGWIDPRETPWAWGPSWEPDWWQDVYMEMAATEEERVLQTEYGLPRPLFTTKNHNPGQPTVLAFSNVQEMVDLPTERRNLALDLLTMRVGPETDKVREIRAQATYDARVECLRASLQGADQMDQDRLEAAQAEAAEAILADVQAGHREGQMAMIPTVVTLTAAAEAIQHLVATPSMINTLRGATETTPSLRRQASAVYWSTIQPLRCRRLKLTSMLRNLSRLSSPESPRTGQSSRSSGCARTSPWNSSKCPGPSDTSSS